MHDGQATGHQRADRAGLREFLFLGFGGAAPLGAGGEGFHGHGKQRPHRAQRHETDAHPEQTVVEEYAIDE